MPRPEPTNIIDYNARFLENQKISGWGPNPTIHMPCPFCTASDWLIYRILETRSAMENGSVCNRCGRGARAVFTDLDPGVTFEVVQFTGPDQPDWLEPKMRRVAE